MQEIGNILAEMKRVARIAGDFARKEREFLRPDQIEEKANAQDLVTDLDKRTEEIVVAALAAAFPDFSIIGEEAANKQTEGKYSLYIDPIDGTTNFIHNFPCYAVSIGLVRDSEPVAGVVYAPAMGELFSGAVGIGAHCNEVPIAVSAVTSLGKALCGTGFSNYRKMEKPLNTLQIVANSIAQTQGVRRTGSAAIDLCYIAAGRLDCFWEEGLSTWDYVGGVAIIRAAGGRASDFYGNERILGASTIAASNDLLHKDLLAFIEPILKSSET